MSFILFTCAFSVLTYELMPENFTVNHQGLAVIAAILLGIVETIILGLIWSAVAC